MASLAVATKSALWSFFKSLSFRIVFSKFACPASCCAEQRDRYGGVRRAGRLRGSGPGTHPSTKKHPRGLVRRPAVHREWHPLQRTQVKPRPRLLPSHRSSGLEMSCAAAVDDYTVREKPGSVRASAGLHCHPAERRATVWRRSGLLSTFYKLRDDFYSSVWYGWRNC